MARTSGDGDVILEAGFDGRGIQKGIATTEKGIDKLGNSFKRLGAMATAAFSVVAIVNFGKASVEASNRVENSFKGLQSIIEGQGRSFAKAKGFINDYIKDGLVPASEATTAYKNLATRGYDDTQIKQVMEALKNSSAYGRQASLSMGQAVSSATEGLKNENSILVDNAGVTKNVSMMWKDYAKSIGVGVDSLTKQQKIQAEVNGIIEETRFQMGDAAKMSSTFSGAIAKLQFNVNEMMVAFGDFIKPIAMVVIPVINMAVTAFKNLFNVMAQVSKALFGKNVSLTEQVKEQENSIAGSVEGQKELTNAVKDTAKAAKKSLTTFDELQLLTKETAENSGGGGSGVIKPPTVGGGDLEVDADITISPQIQEIVERIKRLFEPLKEINIDNIINAFSNLKIALDPFVKNLFEGLAWFWVNILVPFATWTIEDLIPAFLNLLAAAIRVLNVVLEALKPLGTWLWDNFLKPLADFTGGIIISVIEGLTAALNAFSDWADENQEIVQAIATTLLGFFAGLWVYNTAKNVATWIVGTLVPAFMKLITSISTIGLSSGMAAGAFGVLAAGIIYLAANWNKLNGAQQVVTILGALAAAAIAAAIAIAFFHTAWSVGIAAAAIVAGIALIAGTTLFTMSNAKVPSGGGTGGGTRGDVARAQSFGSNTNFMKSPLPALARGAVLPPNKPFMAMVGDQKNGTNIEAPLDTIVNATKAANAEFNERMLALLEQIRDKDNTIELDGDVVSKTVIGNINNTFRRTGRMPIGQY